VIQIMRLHMDAVKAFDAERESGAEAEWTEEDERDVADIVKEVDELEFPDELPDEDGEDSDHDTGDD